MDIPRLCRALAIPGELAEQFVEANKTKQYTDGLDIVTQSTNRIADILQSYFYLHNDNDKNNNNNNNNKQLAGYLSDISPVVEQATGNKPTTFIQFAKDYAGKCF